MSDARPRDLVDIFARRGPPPRVAPRARQGTGPFDARRSLEAADRVLAAVRAALAPALAPVPAPAPPPPAAPDRFLEPALAADYDGRGRLVVTPGWLLPDGAILPPWAVTEPLPERMRDAFGTAVRVVEGDAIPDALAALSVEPFFRPSARVRATRVHEGPRLARLETREGAPGWLELDARYLAGPHEVRLRDVLRAAGARYLRIGDDFVALPSGPLVDEAAAHGLTSESEAGLRLPVIALFRCLALEPDAPLAEAAPAPLPAGYTSTLRPHQRAGLDWLWSLRRAGLGGVLADDMGLGKTHMALALVQAALETDAALPTLVVAPTSVVDAWIEKARAFTPGLEPVRSLGPGRAVLLENLGPRHLVVTSYGILIRDEERLSRVRFEIAILDEAHRVKNPETEAARAARRLEARMRLALTGTPIENRPAELCAVLDFAVPGYLPPQGELEDLDRLRRLVRPFKLRRRKEDVLADLPAKLEETRPCDLSEDQVALYREILSGARKELARQRERVGDLRRGGAGLVPLLAAITRLKRVCDHPALVLPDGRGAGLRSGKLAAFRDVLSRALAARKKVVVFTQYLEMMDLLERELAARGIAFSELRGSTRDRAAAIRRFQEDPACEVMVVSLLAGGLGIDLTSATVVIHYDRWWNAAREDQATDRVHRIGQTRGVEVVKLLTRGTLEERIDRLIAEKARLMDEVVGADDPALARTLDRAEIAAILEGGEPPDARKTCT